MTTDQGNKRVSDAYRELAGESTPADLDARIMDLAAREIRSRYGLARAWIRPVAWAATIGLSLAFVLEMTLFVDAPPVVDALPPTISEERARQDAEVMKIKREDAERQAIAGQPDVPASATPLADDAMASPDPAAAAEMPPPLTPEKQVTLPSTREDEMQLPSTVDEDVPLRRAEERARRQTEAVRADFAAAMTEGSQIDQSCDSVARATADSWYACILELRRQGLADAATSEFDSLVESFPDFREPQPE